MKINGYNIVCEIFNKQENEKILKKYPIIQLSIYQGNKLIIKRFLTARLCITNNKIVIDHLSTLIPFPTDFSNMREMFKSVQLVWKPVKAIEVPYQFLDDIKYNKKNDTLVINTLKEDISIIIKTKNTKRVSKEVIDLVQKINDK